jgi:hypothetical protein
MRQDHDWRHGPEARTPNDTRVRGAGPARKTFLRPKACTAPHPLQPIVRPRRATSLAMP